MCFDQVLGNTAVSASLPDLLYISGIANNIMLWLGYCYCNCVRVRILQVVDSSLNPNCWRSQICAIGWHTVQDYQLRNRQCPLVLAPLVRGPQMVYMCVCVYGMNLKYALCWHIHISVHSVLCQCYTQTHAHTHTPSNHLRIFYRWG